MKYQFTLDLGDLSCDGHCRSESILLESNTPLKDFRELYYSTKLKTPEISLDEGEWDNSRDKTICAEYEDSSISKEQIELLGLDSNNYKHQIEEEFLVEDFAKLFIDYMIIHNPRLELKIVEKPNYDSFNDMKSTDEKRIGLMGYGLFY